MIYARQANYVMESIAQAKRALQYGHNFGYEGFTTDKERTNLCRELRTLLLTCADVIKEVEELNKPKPTRQPRSGAKWSILAR